MIGHEQIDAERLRPRRRRVTSDAAVDGDDDTPSLGMQAVDRLRLQTIAVGQALGDVMRDIGAQPFQCAPHHNGGADAIGVVVAVHRDWFVPVDGLLQPIDRTVEIGQRRRIMQVIETGMEKTLGGGQIGNTALHEQSRHRRMDRQLPLNPFRRRRVARINMVPDRRNVPTAVPRHGVAAGGVRVAVRDVPYHETVPLPQTASISAISTSDGLTRARFNSARIRTAGT